MKDPHLGEQVSAELAQADRARQAGNRGRARVCARRAAGWALDGVPSSQVRSAQGTQGNAYEALRRAARDAALPIQVRQAAARLTARVDEAFSLPFDEDPIHDALEIIGWRWPDWRPPQG